MDLLKVPSNQSLIDSDIGSVDSFPLLDIEELNDEEYGIPPVNELPSLESVLASEDGTDEWEMGQTDDNQSLLRNPTPSPTPKKPAFENSSEGCSLLKYIFLQGVSQQITTASERIGAGTGSAVTAWGERIAVGTSHGLVMAFASQALRWCSQHYKDQASVTSMDYNEDGTRLLVGFARGLVVMYESFEGAVLRTIEACGGGPWGVLKVCWCSTGASGSSTTSAVVADTGGSVWLLRFTRILGVRGTKVSCLFSGARGEVCCVEPLPGPPAGWGCVLALATLSRVAVVCVGGGGGGGGASLPGPSNTLPLLAWQPTHRPDPVLCSARGALIQFHQIRWGSGGLEALPLKRAALPFNLTAMRWLGARRLALIDSKETLHLWDVSSATTLETLDLADAQLVYANAHFKGVATGGKVSEALAIAGGSALGGACVGGGVSGALLLLGKAGLRRVAARAAHAAAHHHADMGRWTQAISTIANEYKSVDGRSSRHYVSKQRAEHLLMRLASDPLHLGDFSTALAAIDLCIQMNLLDTLWNILWEAVCTVGLESMGMVPALAQRAAQGSLQTVPPTAAQMIVALLAQSDPMELQRALMHMPIESLDLHQVLSECRRLCLWQAWIRVTAGAFKDPPLPIIELIPLLGAGCRGDSANIHHKTVDGRAPCPGDALLVYIADCLAGRDYPKGLLPLQDRPGVRHEILGCLLFEGDDPACPLPHIRALLLHDMGTTLRLLGMAYTEPPFMGPMGKLNRLKMTQALHNVIQTAEEHLNFTEDEIALLVLFTANQLSAGSLPPDIHLINNLKKCFSKPSLSREANKLIESSWLSLFTCMNNVSIHLTQSEMLEMAQNTGRLKVKRFLMERENKFDGILETFLNDADSESDMFLYLEKYASHPDRLISKQVLEYAELLASKWPKYTAKFLVEQLPDLIPQVLACLSSDEQALIFTNQLYKLEALDSRTSVTHLELLCKCRPDDVLNYLDDPPPTLLPEQALKLITEYNIKEAEPGCLERSGDLSGALKAAITLMLNGKSKDDRNKFGEEACTLCIRASKVSSHVDAETLWRELIEGVSKLPDPPSAPLPALLLEGAANYLPLPWLVSQLCGGGGHAGALKGALAGLLEAASGSAEAAKAAARLTGRELHAALATSLRAKRILPVPSTICCMCYKPLHLQPLVRAYHCGHAFHLDCDPISGRCSRCGKNAVEIKLTKKQHITKVIKSEEPRKFQLCVVAPPRPDLEGVL